MIGDNILKSINRNFLLENGNTILMLTCQGQGNINLSNKILNFRRLVDLDIKNNDGRTALILAADSGFYEQVRILLKLGANKNIASNYGTALDHAIRGLNLNKKHSLKYKSYQKIIYLLKSQRIK